MKIPPSPVDEFGADTCVCLLGAIVNNPQGIIRAEMTINQLLRHYVQFLTHFPLPSSKHGCAGISFNNDSSKIKLVLLLENQLYFSTFVQ